MVTRAMQAMDEGYLAQGYYIKQRAKIGIENKDKKDSFCYKEYSWTEHISGKWGQWNEDPQPLVDQLRACWFEIKPQTNLKGYLKAIQGLEGCRGN